MNDFDRHVYDVVRRLGKAYGVPIRQTVEAERGRFTAIGAIYAALDRLEEAGYVWSWQEPGGPERGGRARRHFAVCGTLEPEEPATTTLRPAFNTP